MKNDNIPADHWTEFFDQLNHDRTGWLATIQVLHARYGPQNIAVDLPFEGISFDTKGSRASSIEISAGSNPERHVNHVVDLPLHIRQTRESDSSIDVQIEPASGPVTLIHLAAPVQ